MSQRRIAAWVVAALLALPAVGAPAGETRQIFSLAQKAEQLQRDGELTEAAEHLRAAAIRAQGSGRLTLAAALLHRAGGVLLREGRNQDAVGAFEAGLRLLHNEPGFDLQSTFFSLRQMEKDFDARPVSAPDDLYSSAAAADLESEAADPLLPARLLMAAGNAYMAQPQPRPAADNYRAALELQGLDREPLLRAKILTNLGFAERGQGLWPEAEDRFREALRLFAEEDDPTTAARRAYSGLGSLQLDRGDLDGAAASYLKALRLHHQLGDRLGEAHAHAGLGRVSLEREQLKDAETSFRIALTLADELGDRDTLLHARIGLGVVLHRTGRNDSAAHHLEAALDLVDEHQRELRTDEGRVAYLEGVTDLFDLLLDIHLRRAQRDPSVWPAALELSESARGRATVQMLGARRYARRPDHHFANLAETEVDWPLSPGNQAAVAPDPTGAPYPDQFADSSILPGSSEPLPGYPPPPRAPADLVDPSGMSPSVQPPYIPEAPPVEEVADQELKPLEWVEGAPPEAIPPMDPTAWAEANPPVAPEESLPPEIVPTEPPPDWALRPAGPAHGPDQSAAGASFDAPTGPPSGVAVLPKDPYDPADPSQQAGGAELPGWVVGEPRRRSDGEMDQDAEYAPGYNPVRVRYRHVPPLPRLSFHVLPESTAVFAVTADGTVTGHVAALGEEELIGRIEELRLALAVESSIRGMLRGVVQPKSAAADPGRAREILAEFYRELIGPVADRFPPSDEPVALVPHGPLWVLPLAALIDESGGWLADRWPMVLAVSGEALQTIRQEDFGIPLAERRLLAVGDPVIPEKLWESSLTLRQLPGAAQEARAIAAMLPEEERRTLLLGPEADAGTVKARLGQYDIVHLATHGIAAPENPLDSFLVLAESSTAPPLLTAREVSRDLDVPADLVVLSACQSGLGRVSGEGMLGLSRSFLVAGARSVLVSLWSVNDEATAELMTAFYRAYLDGRSKAQALQAAMRSLRAEPEFDDPVFWAPFFLMGAES